MASLTFAVKFSMTLFLLGLHLALFVLFALSLAIRSGGSTEAVALGIEATQLVLLPIRLYYYIRFRDSPARLKHEVLFFLCTWTISLTGAIWVSIHTPSLLEDFAGLAHPEPAAIAVITLTWLAWTLNVHLIWVAVQETFVAQDEEDEREDPIRWPGYTTPPRISRPKRLSAKVVAVAHGSDPLLWSRKKDRQRQGAPVQPAMPTYNPRDRQPQMRTTYNQWYDGEAV